MYTDETLERGYIKDVVKEVNWLFQVESYVVWLSVNLQTSVIFVNKYLIQELCEVN